MADYEGCLATEDSWPTAQMTTRGFLCVGTVEGGSLALLAQFTSAAAIAAGDEAN